MEYLLPAGLSLALIALIFFLFLALRRFISHLIDRRIAAYQANLLSTHYDEVQNIYQKMRGWKHDYHNHIQTLKAYLALNQVEEMKGYLDILDDDLTAVDPLIKTGNIMLDAILNSKLSLIASKKIRVSAKAQVPARLTVNEVDLCTIIGNLLDNALESAEKVPLPDERFIRVYIGILKQQLYISVTNSTGGELKKIGRAGYLSTKAGPHGFGLKRIDALVEKYGGYLNRQNEPGVFAAEIMLPL